MEGTLSIVKMDSNAFRVLFYGTEMPEGMNPSASYIARGIEGLGRFLDAIGVHSDKQQAILDALKIESSTNILSYFISDELLERFGLV